MGGIKLWDGNRGSGSGREASGLSRRWPSAAVRVRPQPEDRPQPEQRLQPEGGDDWKAGTSEWTSSSRATGASAFSGSQSPASNSITAGGPSAHGAAPISSYMPGGNGVGLTGTSVAGVSISGVSVTGTRAAGTSIAGLGLAAIPAEHWARRLASSRAGTAGGFTTEPLSAVRRRPAFVSVGTPKVAAALPTVAAAVAAAGSSLPRSVNPGPPRPNYGAGIRRSPGEQTVAVRSPDPGLPRPHSGCVIRTVNRRRSPEYPPPRYPRPPSQPTGSSGPAVTIWSSHARRRFSPTAAVIQGLNRPRTTAARRNDVNQASGKGNFVAAVNGL